MLYFETQETNQQKLLWMHGVGEYANWNFSSQYFHTVQIVYVYLYVYITGIGELVGKNL